MADNVEKLGTRQRLAITGIVEGKTPRQAMLDAGYTEHTASNPTANLLSKPAVQIAFKDMLKAAGCTDELLATRLIEGLNATELKFWAKDGSVMEEREVVDYGERRAHLEIALKLFGHLIEKHEITGKLSLAEILERAEIVKNEKVE